LTATGSWGSWSNNTNAGTAKGTFTADGNFTGVLTDVDAFTIVAYMVAVTVNFAGTNAPNINIWLDTTGSETYQNAKFKTTGTANKAFDIAIGAAGTLKAELVSNGKHYWIGLNTDSPVSTPKTLITIGAISQPTNLNFSIKVVELYKITYNYNNGTGLLPQEQYKIYNVEYEILPNFLSAPGGFADNWNTSPDGNGTDYLYKYQYTSNQPLTLYAKWRDGYIIWKTLQSSDSAGDLSYTLFTESIPYDTLITPPSVTNVHSQQYEYEFKGWSLLQQVNFEIIPDLIDLTNTLKGSSNPTYYAVYMRTVRKYIITFMEYNSTLNYVILQEVQCEYGSIPEIPTDFAEYVYTEDYMYTFAGWKNEHGDTITNFTPTTGDRVYYAKYIGLVLL
jgi:hypothetical protein